MQHTFIKFIIIIIGCLILTGCGFKLRGQSFIPPELHAVYINSNDPYGEFEARLHKSFNEVGIQTPDSPLDAAITLNISQTSLSYFVNSIGTSSQATIYTVNYQTTIDFLDSTGKILVPAQTVSSTANLTLNANQLLGTNNQIDVLSEQLQYDVIDKIIDLLGSTQIKQAIHHKKTIHRSHKKHSHENRH